MSAKIDLEKARRDPASIFPSPEALAEHPGLERRQKIEILERWSYDAELLETAEDEGMPVEPDPNPGALYRRIRQLIEGLEAEEP